MLRFNKGFLKPKNSNDKLNETYKKFGRIEPEEIITKKFEEQMRIINSVKPESPIKPEQPKRKFDPLNGFKNIKRIK